MQARNDLFTGIGCTSCAAVYDETVELRRQCYAATSEELCISASKPALIEPDVNATKGGGKVLDPDSPSGSGSASENGGRYGCEGSENSSSNSSKFWGLWGGFCFSSDGGADGLSAWEVETAETYAVNSSVARALKHGWGLAVVAINASIVFGVILSGLL
jgi:hypothetical protein